MWKEYISPVLNAQAARPVAGVGSLAPDVYAGVRAGVLLWDSSRERTASCIAPSSREESRDSEMSVERRKSLFPTIPMCAEESWAVAL